MSSMVGQQEGAKQNTCGCYMNTQGYKGTFKNIYGYIEEKYRDKYIYDFSFIDEVTNNDIVLIKYGGSGKTGYNAPKIGNGSQLILG